VRSFRVFLVPGRIARRGLIHPWAVQRRSLSSGARVRVCNPSKTVIGMMNMVAGRKSINIGPASQDEAANQIVMAVQAAVGETRIETGWIGFHEHMVITTRRERNMLCNLQKMMTNTARKLKKLRGILVVQSVTFKTLEGGEMGERRQKRPS